MDNAHLQNIKQRYGIVGNCEALGRALEIALKIAHVDLSVLITGENGVGKEIFPRVIHEHSARKNKKYLAVNCGAIPEGTIDSELFGHEKGAFTGAVERRDGYFSVANGGTLFLDEVGELPMQTQARLLRVLETGEYIPVGSSEVKKTNVRIVAATNVDMERAIAEKKFREDLYYRLNSISIQVPPLRERGTDALLLFRKFALEMSEKYKMPAVRLDEDAQKMLLAYSWPGNVRQLKNLAENMSVTSEEREITAEILRSYLPKERANGQMVSLTGATSDYSYEKEREFIYKFLFELRRDVTDLRAELQDLKKELGLRNRPAHQEYHGTTSPALPMMHADSYPSSHTSSVDEAERGTYMDVEEVKEETGEEEDKSSTASLVDLEKETIKKVLDQVGGKRRVAAKMLDISERTLYRKIKEFGLNGNDYVD